MEKVETQPAEAADERKRLFRVNGTFFNGDNRADPGDRIRTYFYLELKNEVEALGRVGQINGNEGSVEVRGETLVEVDPESLLPVGREDS